MKYYFSFICLIFAYTHIPAQKTTTWAGSLKVGSNNLRVAFELFAQDSNGKAFLHSPDQDVYEIPATATWSKDSLTVTVNSINASFAGVLQNDTTVVGVYKQSGNKIALTLIKSNKISKPKRPQHPQPPYNYYTEDVTFENTTDSVTLAGTLVLPKKDGKFPIVVLVSGSGPQDRNEELLGHKPFLVLADYLAKKGIGSLRYDDRGVGSSTGKFSSGTSFDFANDAEAAVNYLVKRKEAKSIGMAGHSEGGLIAPIVATRNNKVNYIVLMAGPGVSGDKILEEQIYLIAKVQGEKGADEGRIVNRKIFNIIRNETNIDTIKKKVYDIAYEFRKTLDSTAKPLQIKQETQAMVYQMTTPWMLNFLRYEPSINLKKVKCPVLAINGDKDLQVPADMNLNAIKKIITSNGNKRVTTKKYKNLNHLFQTTATGNPTEYGKLEETFNEQVMKDVAAWILKLQTK